MFPYFSIIFYCISIVSGCLLNIAHVTKLKSTDNILHRPTENYWKYVKYPIQSCLYAELMLTYMIKFERWCMFIKEKKAKLRLKISYIKGEL